MNKSTSQVKRLITSKFSNGKRYLYESVKVFQQPSYYVKKILLLTDYIIKIKLISF